MQNSIYLPRFPGLTTGKSFADRNCLIGMKFFLKCRDALEHVFCAQNVLQNRWRRGTRMAIISFLIGLAPNLPGAEIKWTHLSSKNGDLPVPGRSAQQTGSLVADLDRDGINDFVLSFRKVA